MRKSYPTDVSDKEWTLLEPLFFPEGAARKAGRVASVRSVRECYPKNGTNGPRMARIRLSFSDL